MPEWDPFGYAGKNVERDYVPMGPAPQAPEPAMPPVGPLSQSSEDAHDTAINEALAAAEARRQILPDRQRTGAGAGVKAPDIIPENQDVNRANIPTAADPRSGTEVIDDATVNSAANHISAVNRETDAVAQGLGAVARQERINRNVNNDAFNEVQENQAARQANIERQLKELEQGTKDLASHQVSSKKFWANPGNIFAALAASLSPLGSGRLDGQKMIDNMIAQDIADQQAEYEHAKGALAEQRTTVGQYRQLAGDAEIGDQLLLAQKHEEAASKLQEIAALSKIPEAQARGAALAQVERDKANSLRMSIADHLTRDPSATKIPGMKAATLAGRVAITGGPSDVRGAPTAPKDAAASLEPVKAAYRNTFGKEMSPELVAAMTKGHTQDTPPPPRAGNLAQIKADAKAAEKPDVISGPMGGPDVISGPSGTGSVAVPGTRAAATAAAQATAAPGAQKLTPMQQKAAAAVGSKTYGTGNITAGGVAIGKDGSVVTTLPTQNVKGSAEEGKALNNQAAIVDREEKAKAQSSKSLSLAQQLLDEEAYRRMGIQWRPGKPHPDLTPAEEKRWQELRKDKEEEALNDKQKIANKLHDLKWFEANQGFQDVAESQAALLAQFGGDPHKVNAYLGTFRGAFGKMGEGLYAKGASTGVLPRDKSAEAAYAYLHKVAAMSQAFKHEQSGSAVSPTEREDIAYLTSPDQPFLDQVNSNNQFRQTLNSKYQGAMKISKDGIGAMLYQGTAGLGKVYKAGDLTPRPVGKPK